MTFAASKCVHNLTQTSNSIGKLIATTVIPIYIGRQVIRQSIMHLFPVTGVHPRIYFPWQAPWQTGRETIFFFPFGVFLMKKWLETTKPDNRGESLRSIQEVSKVRITSVADHYFTNLWRVEHHRVGVHQVLNIGTGRRPRKHV